VVASGKLARAGGFVLLLIIPVYFVGLVQSPILGLRSTTESCAIKPLADPPVDESLLPLKFRCLWQDGTSTDMVSGVFNQLLLALAVITVILFLLAVWTFLRSRADSTSRSDL
jgi:hypothetical protein